MQIGSLEAYRDSCNMSVATISVVSECPTNVSSYKEAVRNKNCSSLAADARHCTSFQYHCVLSEDLKNAVEVCAPSINIIGKKKATLLSQWPISKIRIIVHCML